MCAFCSTSSTVVPRGADVGDDAEHLLHDQRREPERGLVEQQQARPRHQPARHGHHLQLPAGEGPAERVDQAAQIGEMRQHLLELRVRATARDRRPRLEAPSRMFSRTVRPGKMRRPSGTCEMPARTIAPGFWPRIGLPSKRDAARDVREQAGDGAQRRRLAGAVGAEQGDDLALLHRDVEPVQHLAGIVAGVQAFDREQVVMP